MKDFFIYSIAYLLLSVFVVDNIANHILCDAFAYEIELEDQKEENKEQEEKNSEDYLLNTDKSDEQNGIIQKINLYSYTKKIRQNYFPDLFTPPDLI